MIVLGIETSCDETAASIVKFDQKKEKALVLSNVVFSQIPIHQKYGGVIPEIAAREHVLTIIPVINEALYKAKIKPSQLDYLSVTKGPGLITSLQAGTETVKVLSYVWQKPIIEVNHIEGHIFANFIEQKEKINYPALILTVSGGHTTLILMTKNHKIKIIGETLDDAAGEAFDKGAKMMNLGYPGGPKIAALANEYKANIKVKNKKSKYDIYPSLNFPRPMINSNNYDFSFSGLKTALLYQLQADKNKSKRLAEYAYYYQEAIIEVLVKKTLRAAEAYKVKTVMLSGGVSANQELRLALASSVKNKLTKVTYLCPEFAYTTDNAAMIATAGIFLAKNKRFKSYKQLKADPSWEL